MKQYPPEDVDSAQHECFFLLKRLQDMVDIIDGKQPFFEGGKDAALKYARDSLKIRTVKKTEE